MSLLAFAGKYGCERQALIEQKENLWQVRARLLAEKAQQGPLANEPASPTWQWAFFVVGFPLEIEAPRVQRRRGRG